MYLQLTNESNKLIKNLTTFLKGKDLVQINKGMKQFLKLIYKVLQYSEKNSPYTKIISTLKRETVELNDNLGLLTGKYIDERISNDIYSKLKTKYSLGLKIFDKNIKINLYCERKKKMESVYRTLYFIQKILFLIVSLNPSVCKKDLTIHLFDYCGIHSNKKLPKNQGEILGPYHINSGYTYGCIENNEIVIFRQEECMKVFIHELLHAQGFDTGLFNNYYIEEMMHSIFSLKCKLNVNEAYIEFLTFFLYSGLNSYLILREKKEINKKFRMGYSEFENTFKIVFSLERLYSLMNVIKILDFMNLSYENMTSENTNDIALVKMLYKERTNVFCYYIVKIFFLFCNNSLLQSIMSNKLQFSSQEEMKLHIQKVLSCYKSPELFANLDMAKKYLSRKRKASYLMNTMNMCLFVWKL